MRIFILLSLALLTIFACNNDITSNGDDFIDNQGSVQKEIYKIYKTYTVRIDSFPASSANPFSALTTLSFGIAEDKYTGKVTSTPYVQLAPSTLTKFTSYTSFDSLMFHFNYKGEIWGDTLPLQTMRLYHTNALPDTRDYMNNSNTIYRTFYNNFSIPYDEKSLIGETEFYPTSKELSKYKFRISDTLGENLLEYMRLLALEYSSDIDGAKRKVLDYLGDIVIVPDPGNTCLFGLSNTIDSINMTLHYHIGGNSYQMVFNRTDGFNQYTFINIDSDLSGSPYDILETQRDEIDFIDAKQSDSRIGQAITEGMTGLMIKVKLPVKIAPEKYSTIIKAELVFFPQDETLKDFQKMDSLYLYKSNSQNSLISAITGGALSYDPLRPNDAEYRIDITNYYINLCKQSSPEEDSYIMASINVNSLPYSFDRLVIDEYPELHVYYTYYDMHE